MARNSRLSSSRRAKPNRAYRRRVRTLRAEQLESRRLLALITWDAGGDGSSWNDPLNWSGDVLPTSADDVVISLPTSNPTIRLSSADASVASLVADEALRVESGRTLTVTGTADINAALTIDGGTLRNGAWDIADGSLSFTSNTSTLDAVTLAQPLTITGGRVEVTGGTTFPSAQLDGGSLGVEPGFSLPGNIDIQGTSASYLYVVGNGTATIPAGRTVTVGSSATLYLGQSPDQAIGGDRSDAWFNVGTLETTSGTIHILAGAFLNESGATVAAGTGNIYVQTRTTENRLGAAMRTVGGNLEIRPEKPYPVSFQNDGTVEVHNGTFDTNVGWNYSDTGTLILDNATTTFGGSV
ncbi:MAG TPA: hypothetical protein ENJ50_10770, partial [Planctomycetaceae bacterium]|nr:hypothetical protein [Planctomycetaceae bacterium]